MGGEDQQPGIGQRAQQHQHVAVLALAAHLVGVDARGLVAVMPVGDQQLGVGQRRLQLGDQVRVGRAPEPVDGAVEIGGGGERLLRRQLGPCVRSAASVAVRKQREDGGQVRLRGAGQPQPVLLGSRMGALVGPDAPGAVVVHVHAREEAGAHPAAAVRGQVVLAQHPDRRRVLVHQDAALAPVAEGGGGLVVAGRQVDVHHVVGAAGCQLGPQLVVDHVVGRGDQVVQRAGLRRVVAQRAKRLDVGHGRTLPSGRLRNALSPPARLSD